MYFCKNAFQSLVFIPEASVGMGSTWGKPMWTVTVVNNRAVFRTALHQLCLWGLFVSGAAHMVWSALWSPLWADWGPPVWGPLNRHPGDPRVCCVTRRAEGWGCLSAHLTRSRLPWAVPVGPVKTGGPLDGQSGVISSLVQWSPTAGPQTTASRQVSGNVRLEIKSTESVVCWVIPKPAPCPRSVEEFSATKSVPQDQEGWGALLSWVYGRKDRARARRHLFGLF